MSSSRITGSLVLLVLVLSSISLTPTSTRAQTSPKKILFYGPTAGGLAASTPNIEITVWDEATWSSQTTAAFAAFDAIVFGDQPECFDDPSRWSTAVANKDVWSAAVTGNIIINGTDPDYHDKTLFVHQSVQFAMDGIAPGPGLYVSLSCAYHQSTREAVQVELLAGLGNFVVRSVGHDFCPSSAHKVATHPALDEIDDAYLSGWGCSTHEGFDSWPASFAPLAIITDAEVANYTASDGRKGLVYILASGAKPLGISLDPVKGSSPVGTTHTVTATLTDPTKDNPPPVPNKLIGFRVLNGPNKGTSGTCTPDSCTTDATGQVTWTYVGDGGEGDDSIQAFVDQNANATPDPGEPQTTSIWNWSASIADVDEDGLLDTWETDGVWFDSGAGPQFIDLPAMGSSLNKRDIFVQADWMTGHKPSAAALRKVYDAFVAAPVSDGKRSVELHIDAGPDSIMRYASGTQTELKWGRFSRAGERPVVNPLGSGTRNSYNWRAFDVNYKNLHFAPTGRMPVFHYALFADTIGVDGGPSGVARNTPSSDFIVSLGDTLLVLSAFGFDKDTIQAGTFMHELGHNLGLKHGGGDSVNYKPNYLSVMNYGFQMVGLTKLNGSGKEVSGALDYSREKLDTLDENALNERIGVTGGESGYGTMHDCPLSSAYGFLYYNPIMNGLLGLKYPEYPANGPINWNCSLLPLPLGIDSATVSFNINGDQDTNGVPIKERLEGFDDWSNLNFRGGSIGYGGPGNGGIPADPPMETLADELTAEEATLAPPTELVRSPFYAVYFPLVWETPNE